MGLKKLKKKATSGWKPKYTNLPYYTFYLGMRNKSASKKKKT